MRSRTNQAKESGVENTLRRIRIPSRLGILFVIVALGFVGLAAVSLHDFSGMLSDERKKSARHVVEAATSVARHYHERAESGELSQAEAKERAAETIREMRYDEHADGSREYVWINDDEPRVIMHPTSPELEGEYVGDLEDPTGHRLFESIVEVAETQGSGFVEYAWQLPGADEGDDPVRKVSFVQEFEPWGWILGSGVYMQRLEASLWAFGWNYAWQAGLVLGVITLVIFVIARSIVRPLQRAVTDLKSINSGDNIDLTQSMSDRSSDAISDVTGHVDGLLHATRDVVSQVADAAGTLSRSAENMSGITQRVFTKSHFVSRRSSRRASVSQTQDSETLDRRSWCITRRRARSIQAWVRSTTHRLACTTKPLASACTVNRSG